MSYSISILVIVSLVVFLWLHTDEEEPVGYPPPTAPKSKIGSGGGSGGGSDFPSPVFLPRGQMYAARMGAYREEGVTVTMEADELQGESRVVLDGVLSQNQCDQLIKLVTISARQGDGYADQGDRPSPHTLNERYAGITVDAAAKMVPDGAVGIELVREYLRTSQYTLNLLNAYYNLKNPMYFDYTHLAVREAIEGFQENRKDLSHPVHSDNCHIQSDGSCPRVSPAYTQRDFSGLLYLNSNFEGGNFFFAHQNQSEHITVTPRCGRLVAFPSGHYHAVKPLTSGERSVVAQWFTLNKDMKDMNHAHAHHILDTFEQSGYVSYSKIEL